MFGRSGKECKAGHVLQQVTVLIAKHEALLDEEALSEMKAASDEKQAEALAAKGSIPEDLVRVSLIAKKETSPPAPTKAQILANQKAKVTMLCSVRPSAQYYRPDVSTWKPQTGRCSGCGVCKDSC